MFGGLKNGREPVFRTAALAALFAAEGLQAAAPTVKDMNGRDSFPLGVNYAWVDWGRDFHSVGFEERFRRIQKDLDLMRSRGVRTLRWWVYTDFVESPLWKGTGKDLRCTGLPPGWVENFLTVLEAAHERGIRLYPVFSSFDLGRKGFQAVVTHPPTRKSFIEKAVRPILEAAGKHPGVFAWDILNEPEWLVRKEDGGGPPPGTLGGAGEPGGASGLPQGRGGGGPRAGRAARQRGQRQPQVVRGPV